MGGWMITVESLSKGPPMNRVFWLVLGFAAGSLVEDICGPHDVHAVATSGFQENLIATGQSNQRQIENCWLLDYKQSRLLCIALNNAGGLGGFSEVDLLKEFKLDASGERPHFMMVTGRYESREIADVLYLAETTSSQMMILSIPPRALPNGSPGPIQLISRFSYGKR